MRRNSNTRAHILVARFDERNHTIWDSTDMESAVERRRRHNGGDTDDEPSSSQRKAGRQFEPEQEQGREADVGFNVYPIIVLLFVATLLFFALRFRLADSLKPRVLIPVGQVLRTAHSDDAHLQKDSGRTFLNPAPRSSRGGNIITGGSDDDSNDVSGTNRNEDGISVRPNDESDYYEGRMRTPKMDHVPLLELIWLPSHPFSGSHLTRKLVEAATARPTLSLYTEDGTAGRELDGLVKFISSSSAIESYLLGMGLASYRERVPCDPIVLKTHYPYSP